MNNLNNNEENNTLLNELNQLTEKLNNELIQNLNNQNYNLSTNQNINNSNSQNNIKLKETDINDFIIEKTSQLINSSLDVINQIKDRITRTVDPDELESLASLIKATSSSIDTLNSINLERKKQKSALKLKQLEIQGKKQLLKNSEKTTNNIFIGNREELLKILNNIKNEKENKYIKNVELNKNNN